jgi:hypothetical protein
MNRMCSCCREPIANGSPSLILNGVYAHVGCVEDAMREPWSMQQVTDDQLRAECCRRGIDTMTPEMTAAWARDREQYLRKSTTHASDEELRAECERRWPPGEMAHFSPVSEYMKLQAERDEWKARAETAAALLAIQPQVPFAGRVMTFVTTDGENCTTLGHARIGESGPGIAATKPTDEHWVDPLDLLADDAR